MSQQIALIVGAGPAGLTAAYELATRTNIKPIIFEASSQVGGISKTVNYKGNRIDIGGHRFFSKSDRIMNWWTQFMPLQATNNGEMEFTVSYQNNHRSIDLPESGLDPEVTDEVMLVRTRVSRILFGRKFYDYPIKFSPRTFANLGVGLSLRIFASYARARLAPIRPEVTLRDYIINRFGQALYETFFENYTEKVWGVPCSEIPADWGAQRIKGVSVSKLIMNGLRKLKPRQQTLAQKDVETSLIERFLYPKYGPGQLWELVAKQICEAGGEIYYHHRVVAVNHEEGRITSVVVEGPSGNRQTVAGDMLFSSMPVQDLFKGWQPAAPASVRAVSDGLTYRDFITVGVLLKRLALEQGIEARDLARDMPDNWIYVQEPDVKVGRLQLFNNWSPYLVADPDTIWMGLEYFVNEGDDFWTASDDQIVKYASGELDRLGVAHPQDLLDAVVVRTKKAYPAYFGSYDRFDQIQDYVLRFDNLYCVGRNGMHRYNNQDHSMLTAMVAVDGIVSGQDLRSETWQVNTEQDYHEHK